MKTLSALALVSAMAVAPLGAGVADAQIAAPVTPVSGPVVTLSVTESIESAPDMATVGTGVQTRAQTAKEAMTLNATAMDRLVAAILKAGIERKDIQTSGINLNPQYDYSSRTDGQPPRFIGYEASNQLSVKVRKIASAGDVIDRMVGAGATNINGPSFGLQDDAPVLEKARAKAIATGKARAQFYAAQAGYRSAKLFSISETGDVSRPIPMPVMARADFAAAPKATSVEPGQLSTSITLAIQYVLEQ